MEVSCNLYYDLLFLENHNICAYFRITFFFENYLQFVTFSDLAVSVSYYSLLTEFPLLLYEYFITVFNIVYLEKINQICWLFYWKVHLVNYFLRHKRDLIYYWWESVSLNKTMCDCILRE